MLVFGPYGAIPRNENFIVYNLSSPTEAIPRLPGLFIQPGVPVSYQPELDQNEMVEKSFDMWYYDYVLNDPTACASLMQILTSLYEGNKVYICIADYINVPVITMLNESFMKMIQARYDIKYSIINNQEDYLYIDSDGCDFMSVNGIYNFDNDRKRFMQLTEEQRILFGGGC